MTSLVVVAALPGAEPAAASVLSAAAGTGQPPTPAEVELSELAHEAARLLGWSTPDLVPELEPAWVGRPEVAHVAQRAQRLLHGSSAGTDSPPRVETSPSVETSPASGTSGGGGAVLVSEWNAVLLPLWLSLSPRPPVLLYWAPPELSASALGRSLGISPACALATWEHWARSALSSLGGAPVFVLEEGPDAAEALRAAIAALGAGAEALAAPLGPSPAAHSADSPVADPALDALRATLRSLAGHHSGFSSTGAELPPPSLWGTDLLASRRAARRHADEAAEAWARSAAATEDAESCARALEWASRQLADALEKVDG